MHRRTLFNFLLPIAALGGMSSLHAQETAPVPALHLPRHPVLVTVTAVEPPDAPLPLPESVPANTALQAGEGKPAEKPDTGEYQEGQQSKRILFIIPNFRSVSVDAHLPALSPKEKFVLAITDSFDYSSFIYVGMVAGAAQAMNSTPEFRQGAKGYGRYYWHSFADNLDGNLWSEAVVPTLTREDPRYYTLGRGGFVKRLGYSLSRSVITRNDRGRETFNISEIAGNGVAAGIADFYYPAQERTFSNTASKFGAQIGLDAAANVLKEFWPDIAHDLFRQKVETTDSK